MRREQADEDRAPVDRGRERRDEEDDAHEHNDAREDLLDDLVRADPHARKTQDGDDHDDGYHGSGGRKSLDAQDAAGHVAGLVRDVAHENGDDNNHDRNPFDHVVGNTIADVFTQSLLRHDADARGHLLKDHRRNRCEQQRPQHRV